MNFALAMQRRAMAVTVDLKLKIILFKPESYPSKCQQVSFFFELSTVRSFAMMLPKVGLFFAVIHPPLSQLSVKVGRSVS